MIVKMNQISWDEDNISNGTYVPLLRKMYESLLVDSFDLEKIEHTVGVFEGSCYEGHFPPSS
jgi:hypothetical protein